MGMILTRKLCRLNFKLFESILSNIRRVKQVKHHFFDLLEYFSNLSQGQSALMNQVCELMQLVLVMAATNATSERSFSALRRVKSCLRATMLQERLNYLMLLHVFRCPNTMCTLHYSKEPQLLFFVVMLLISNYSRKCLDKPNKVPPLSSCVCIYYSIVLVFH